MDIGIEVHVQLQTKSKIFCSCSNALTEKQNQNICQICAGYPGVLPVLNRQVVEFAIMAGLGTNCQISLNSEFDRKHYFYPDLPKNYQITQNYFPICKNGFIMIRLDDGSEKKIRINRIHIEEDAGKNSHSDLTGESYVDLNRTGTPLLEIVSEPDITSGAEAKAYLKALRLIAQYAGISNCNMEEGSFRADTNLSVRKKESEKLGTRCELKNINSFKFITDAIEYESERQILTLQAGEKIRQETRLWDSKNRKSFAMRSKEDLADYRYCTDPDLALIQITDEHIQAIKKQMPEMPYEKFHRYIKIWGLSAYEADVIVSEFEFTAYFEKAMNLYPKKSVVNWFLRNVIGLINEQKIVLRDCKVTPEKLAKIVQMVDVGIINNAAAQEIFQIVATTSEDPENVVADKGLKQIGSVDELEKIVLQVLKDNPALIEQYKSGKQNVFGFLVGSCMKATGGKGNPKILQDLLKKHLQ
ncbi:glutaminyl-tRNA synthase (glutamine-hydrolyzing) subunit B [candidate division TM6 bacterium RIFCSPHIGHO2_12_FULL_38_8]|nr:MAG: glutaminyl-tRNA synthase (glutamine-hydrolyzing) subunit B [candidate division TM6 bacterium RIFCSPHIGHO2_12_FULL_38_8]